MNALLYFIIVALLGYVGMYLIYKPQSDKYTQTLNFSYFMLPVPYIYAFFVITSIIAFFTLNNFDFIESLSFWRMILPLVLTPVIYASCTLLSEKSALLITLICVAITVCLQPLEDGNSYPELPVWAFRIIVIILAAIYCFGAIINNFIPHTLLIPQMFVLLGLGGMAALGATPVYIAVCAAIMFGAIGGYLSINFYDVKIEIDNASAITLSYMVCALILMNLGELCFPSCVILTIVFWAELLVALWRRIFVVRAGMLSEHTNYYLAAQKLTIQALVFNIFKVCGVMMFLAWFQLYSVNNYSLLIVSLCISLWLNGLLNTNGGGKQSLREINQEFIANIKQGIQETKDLLNKKHGDE